jgi:hypothetical protein
MEQLLDLKNLLSHTTTLPHDVLRVSDGSQRRQRTTYGVQADMILAKRVVVRGADTCKIVSVTGEINHLLLNAFSAVFRYLQVVKENAIYIETSLNPLQGNTALAFERSTRAFEWSVTIWPQDVREIGVCEWVSW